MSLVQLIEEAFADSIQTKQRAALQLAEPIESAIWLLARALDRGQKILACGNGGSASDALHFAAELVNRFETDRRALPAIALTADVATLTAIANDDSYDRVFARQVDALGATGDVLLAISTSGNSPSVLEAIRAARLKGMTVIGLTGRSGGRFPGLLSDDDILITAPSAVTARIQEVHLLVLHCLCQGVDTLLFGDQ